MKGEVGFEIDTGKWKVGDGVTTWENLPYQGSSIYVGAEAPIKPRPRVGDAWYDTTNKILKICVSVDNSNVVWALAMPNRVYVSASDPSTNTTVNGDIWFDTNKNILYVRVNGEWVADTTTRVRVSETELTTGQAGDIYFNSAAGCLKIHDGEGWQAVASYTVEVSGTSNTAKIVFKAPGKTDQEVTLAASGSASLAVDKNNKKITIGAKDTKYSMNASSGTAQSSAKITLQEDGTDKNNVTIKGTGIANVSYKDNAINLQVGRYKIEAVEAAEDTNGAILRLVQDENKEAPADGIAFQVPVLGGNGVTVEKTAVGSNSQITISGTTYTLSSRKNADGTIDIVLKDNNNAIKGTIKVGEGLAFEANADGTITTIKSTVKVPKYTTSVAEKTGGGATINLNKDNVAIEGSTVNIVGGENSTVSVNGKNITIESTDTTYSLSAGASGNDTAIILTGSDKKTSPVKIREGSNVTVTLEGGDAIKIEADDTTYTLSAVEENNGVTIKLTDSKTGSTPQDIAFVPANNGNVSISLTNDNKKINISVDTVSTINNETANNAIPNVNAIREYIKDKIAAADAMIFRGTVDIVKGIDLPAKPKIGDTYKVISDGKYNNGTIDATIGDIFIYAKDEWVLVPSGDDGNVYHDANLEADQVVLGAGTATVKTLPAGANNQILRMQDGKPTWTGETPLTLVEQSDTSNSTKVVTDIDVDGHTITSKGKDIVTEENKDIKVIGENSKIKILFTYTKNNVVTDLNADTDVLILNGGTASTVL